jgi:hypothetical protein
MQHVLLLALATVLGPSELAPAASAVRALGAEPARTSVEVPTAGEDRSRARQARVAVRRRLVRKRDTTAPEGRAASRLEPDHSVAHLGRELGSRARAHLRARRTSSRHPVVELRLAQAGAAAHALHTPPPTASR